MALEPTLRTLKLCEMLFGQTFAAVPYKKVSESKKTAGGSGKLSEQDETVLDILGRESANLEPVKVEETELCLRRK